MPDATHAHPLVFAPRRPADRLARLGDWMAAHRRAILAAQWVVVVFYALLVVLPAFLPIPSAQARLFSGDAWHERLVLLAQYLFWGLWWPFVILSTMFMGRVWCGFLCPEGMLAEFASRHGRGGAIPRWMRWSGWPVAAFILTTVYGQLVSVYEYPQAALLILGGSTVAAVAVGYLYGKGKRVWCRYLCPVSGIFALLARLAPVHFGIDREAWNRYPVRTHAVDCGPLLNVKKLGGMAQCHACGRCSGHRDAVALAVRSPNAEILNGLNGERPRASEAILLIFGALGVALGAFQWTVSPWFVALKQAAAEWLIDRDILWPLEEGSAWWLLTNHPEAGDVFTWLDGAAILAWILGIAAVVGGLTLGAVRLSARLAGLDWRRLAMGLVPLAGVSLFLGLSMMTATHLRAEGVALSWLPGLRAALLAAGAAWSVQLGFRLLKVSPGGTAPKIAAGLSWLLPPCMIAASWWLVFFVW
ncbi:MAG: 4Fe-4S binding protein [Candidatus Nitricoxidivorans perseverans]|uniref:4Fe-4S binding protein n=1 Tax=Candidatus Nitricoxidivorans perseverans TaxID=2975601 RepID=A0AA49FNE7_9PROT|nr:MAG: 4Fe-4S binding protein [Candidatus Nitricoxidivorans perseverans]